ncbi:MAG: hypothetical protein ACPKQO_04805 [Nitrososphaeraceae archaeon]
MSVKMQHSRGVKAFGYAFSIIFGMIIALGFFVIIISIDNSYGAEFVNEKYDIKFEYPDEWEFKEYDIKSYGIEYDKITIAGFLPNPDPKAHYNFVAIKLYTDMLNLDEFVKIVKNEMLTDEGADVNIKDIIEYDKPVVVIYTDYTPITKHIPSSTNEKNHMLFHRDGKGYDVSFSLPPDLVKKYIQDVLLIPSQITNNFTDN